MSETEEEVVFVQPEDIVTCTICGIVRVSLYKHMKAVHGITCKEYEDKYHQPTASKIWLNSRTQTRWTEGARAIEANKMTDRWNNNPEFRAKALKASSDTITKLNANPTFRAKVDALSSVRLRVLHTNPEFAVAHARRKSEQNARKFREDPEYAKQALANLRISKEDPILVEKNRQDFIKRIKDPEFQAKRLAGFYDPRLTPKRVELLKLRNKDPEFQRKRKSRMKKNVTYKGYYMSTWERDFAIFLDASNSPWVYEPYMEFEKFTYRPDFYLTDFDTYVEIKPEYRSNELWKIRSMAGMGYKTLIIQDDGIKAIRKCLKYYNVKEV
jgi:hypothetical protein